LVGFSLAAVATAKINLQRPNPLQVYSRASGRLLWCAANTSHHPRGSCVKHRTQTAAGFFALLFFCSLALQAQSTTAAPSTAAHTPATSAANQAFFTLSSQANIYRDAGHSAEAIRDYEQALALHKDWTDGWWSLATLYYDGADFAHAQSAFEKLITLAPGNGTARAMLGLCEFETGDSHRALADIQASKQMGVLENQQLRQVVAFHEAVLLQRASEFEAAKKPLAALCQSGVRSRDLANTFGLIALRISDPAVPATGSLAANVVQHTGRAACLASAKQYEQAKAEFERILAVAPNFPLIHYAFGNTLLEARETPAALEQFTIEIALHPQSIPPRLRMAAALYKVDSAAAIPYTQQAIAINQQTPLAHYLLGLLLLDTGAYAAAAPELEAALKAFPQDARIDLSLATAYMHLGRTAEATRARADFARKKLASAAAAPDPLDVPDQAAAGANP